MNGKLCRQATTNLELCSCIFVPEAKLSIGANCGQCAMCRVEGYVIHLQGYTSPDHHSELVAPFPLQVLNLILDCSIVDHPLLPPPQTFYTETVQLAWGLS